MSEAKARCKRTNEAIYKVWIATPHFIRLAMTMQKILSLQVSERTKQFNYNLFCQLLSDNKTTVEKLITNPLIISGIGETYGDLILKKASINKRTKTTEVNKAKAREIFDAIKQVLREASGNSEEEEGDGLDD